MKKAIQLQRIISVNHSAKFDPTVRKALQLIDDGAIGSVLSVHYFRSSEYPAYTGGPLPPQFKEGGFPFRDIGVHALYLMEALLGQIHTLESAHRSTGQHPHVTFDHWTSVAHCQKGTAHFELSWSCKPIQHLLSIHGTRGNIVLDLYLGTCVIHRSLPVPKPAEAIANAFLTSFQNVRQISWNTIRVATGRFVRGADIHESIKAFYSALRNGIEPPVSPLEGKRLVQWLEHYAQQADQERDRMLASHRTSNRASVLITGASGFLGGALTRALITRGERVRLLLRRDAPPEFVNHPSIDIVIGELGDPESVDSAITGVDTVFHVGAATRGPWSDHQCATIGGTTNVVNSCLRHHIRKLVYVSSLSVLNYTGLPRHVRLSEVSQLEASPEKRGFYPNAKLQAEQIVREAIQNHGLPAVILRPGSIFGPGAERVPPYGIVCLGNRWLVIGRGDTILPLVYVDDVVDALLRAAESDRALGRVVHLVDPNQITQRFYLQYVLHKMPVIRVVQIPMSILYVAAASLSPIAAMLRRSAPLTVYRLRSIKGGIEFDCSAAAGLLDWCPSVGVRKGLEITFGLLPDQLAATSPILQPSRQHSRN